MNERGQTKTTKADHSKNIEKSGTPPTQFTANPASYKAKPNGP